MGQPRCTKGGRRCVANARKPQARALYHTATRQIHASKTSLNSCTHTKWFVPRGCRHCGIRQWMFGNGSHSLLLHCSHARQQPISRIASCVRFGQSWACWVGGRMSPVRASCAAWDTPKAQIAPHAHCTHTHTRWGLM